MPVMSTPTVVTVTTPVAVAPVAWPGITIGSAVMPKGRSKKRDFTKHVGHGRSHSTAKAAVFIEVESKIDDGPYQGDGEELPK
jgi:hypothetical protein